MRSRQGSGLHLPPDSPASALVPESIVSENVQTSQEVCEVDSGAGALHEAVSFESNEVAVTAKAPPSHAPDDDENDALQSHIKLKVISCVVSGMAHSFAVNIDFDASWCGKPVFGYSDDHLTLFNYSSLHQKFQLNISRLLNDQ